MKIKHIFIFIISGWTLFSYCQNQEKKTYPQRYGIRVGADLSSLAQSFFDKDYLGIKICADHRFLYRYYFAAECGFERKYTQEDMFSFSSEGGFAKLGVDYNFYDNWYGMENMIFVGGRFAGSVFSKKIDAYTVSDYNTYWGGSVQGTNPEVLKRYADQKAFWLELVVGVKVELLRNLYLCADVRLKALGYQSLSLFPNYRIPGFGRVWEGSPIGVGYNYTLTYLIPFFKQEKQQSKR